MALDQFVTATFGLTGERADLRQLVGGTGAGELVEVALEVGERLCSSAIQAS